jgi:hypothetical protein
MSRAGKGRIIRISPDTYALLESRRADFKSWDSLLRWVLGLPPRRGERKIPFPARKEVWLISGSLRYFISSATARGEAVKRAAFIGSDHVEKPMRMREVL